MALEETYKGFEIKYIDQKKKFSVRLPGTYDEIGVYDTPEEARKAVTTHLGKMRKCKGAKAWWEGDDWYDEEKEFKLVEVTSCDDTDAFIKDNGSKKKVGASSIYSDTPSNRLKIKEIQNIGKKIASLTKRKEYLIEKGLSNFDPKKS